MRRTFGEKDDWAKFGCLNQTIGHFDCWTIRVGQSPERRTYGRTETNDARTKRQEKRRKKKDVKFAEKNIDAFVK